MSIASESQFHKERKAFVLFKETGVLMAQNGFSKSHNDLLKQAGFCQPDVDVIIDTQARGFALKGDIFLYQGVDFLELSQENHSYALQYLPYFRALSLLSPTGRVYSGMITGQIGTKWRPIKQIA